MRALAPAGRHSGGSAAAAAAAPTPPAEELDRVEAFLVKYMFSETLETLLQEKQRTFRRTTAMTPTPVSSSSSQSPVPVLLAAAAPASSAAAATTTTTTTAAAAAAAAHAASTTDHSQCCWKCIVCDKVFTKKGSAKRHCDTAHLEESAAERVECPQCHQRFNRRDDLYAHIRRIHHATGGEQLVQDLIHSSSQSRRHPHNKKARKSSAGGMMQAVSTNSVSLVSHNGHVDVVLPSGGVICPPGACASASAASGCPPHEHTLAHDDNNTCANASAAMQAVQQDSHFRVLHDGHEDVIVNGTLQYYNTEAGMWELHGELTSTFESDLDFLASNYLCCEDAQLQMMPATPRNSAEAMMTLPQGSTLTLMARRPSSDCCPRHHVCSEDSAAHVPDSEAISHMLGAMRQGGAGGGALPPYQLPSSPRSSAHAHAHSHGHGHGGAHSHSHDGAHSHSHGHHHH